MLRKLFTTALCLVALHAAAQQGESIIRSSDTDYHAMGAPMPRIALSLLDSINIAVPAPAPPAAKHKHKKKHQEPQFVTVRTDMVTEQLLNNNANLLVMMFNPTCSHCEDQTDRFEKSIELFKNSKLLLMANPGMRDYLPNFSKTHHVSDYPAFLLGTDSASFIKQTFLYSALPQINVYGPDRKLIKTWAGEVVMDSIKQYIQ